MGRGRNPRDILLGKQLNKEVPKTFIDTIREEGVVTKTYKDYLTGERFIRPYDARHRWVEKIQTEKSTETVFVYHTPDDGVQVHKEYDGPGRKWTGTYDLDDNLIFTSGAHPVYTLNDLNERKEVKVFQWKTDEGGCRREKVTTAEGSSIHLFLDGEYDSTELGAPAIEEYDANGQMTSRSYYEAGRLQVFRDLPSVEKYDENLIPVESEYHQNGRLHREGKPAKIFRNSSGDPLQDVYYRDGEIFNPDGPAVIDYHINGNRAQEIFFRETPEGILPGAENGEPGKKTYGLDGNLQKLCWYEFTSLEQQKLHPRKTMLSKKDYTERYSRIDGPAVQIFDTEGNIISEEYRLDGQLHNLDGPALIQKDTEGNIFYSAIYHYGNKIHEENFSE